MKTNSTLFLLALAMALTLFLPGRGVQAAPQTPHAAPAGVQSPSDSYTDCLRACKAEFDKSIEAGKDLCEHCAVSVFGICFSWVTDFKCIEGNRKKAQRIHDSCVKDCENR